MIDPDGYDRELKLSQPVTTRLSRSFVSTDGWSAAGPRVIDEEGAEAES
jgi:hypothetical protein